MSTYKYQAISKQGTKVNGVVEGYNEIDAIDKIKRTCDIVVKISEIKEKNSALSGLLGTEIGGGKIDMRELAMVCSQFAIMIRSGINIVHAVELVAKKSKDKKLHKIMRAVQDDVEAGRGLADSFEEHGDKYLPVIFIETIRAGEQSGNLDGAFESMYRHYDKQSQNNRKVKSALIYPAFVLVIAVAVIIVLMVKVVPTFTSVFDSYGADLPTITKILIAVSDFFRKYWIVMIIVIVAIIVGIKIYKTTEKGRENLAKLSLKLPLLGTIQEMNSASQFSNNLSALMSAGIPINQAITVTAKVIENYYVSKGVDKLNTKIVEGHNLGDSVAEVGVLPEMLNDMVTVGEETGQLEETLATVGEYYDTELNIAIASALNKLQPALLMVVAAVAGFIVVAIYIAMFDMYGVM